MSKIYYDTIPESLANGFENPFAIQKVIFNDPATIVLWEDGTKTVVKCQDGDEFDPEKGLVMAIAKKALGNQGDYYNVIRDWIDPYYMDNLIPNINVIDIAKSFSKDIRNLDNLAKALWSNKNKDDV